MSAIVTPDLGSLQAKVQAARARAQQHSTIDLEIPGFDGTLWGTFRGLDDYHEAREMTRAHGRIKDETDQELAVAASTLIACSVDTFVPSDEFGNVSLEMPLGIGLAQWLGVEGADVCASDEEALFLIIPATMKLATLAARVTEFSVGAGKDADRELEGNSLAPSS